MNQKFHESNIQSGLVVRTTYFENERKRPYSDHFCGHFLDIFLDLCMDFFWTFRDYLINFPCN